MWWRSSLASGSDRMCEEYFIEKIQAVKFHYLRISTMATFSNDSDPCLPLRNKPCSCYFCCSFSIFIQLFWFCNPFIIVMNCSILFTKFIYINGNECEFIIVIIFKSKIFARLAKNLLVEHCLCVCFVVVCC